MITLTRTGLLLTLSTDTIPAQGSSDVPISFVNDPETYTGYTIQPMVGWYKNGCKQSAVCGYADGTITVPAAAFQQNGEIMLAVALIDPSDANHIEVTHPITPTVVNAPTDPTELPDKGTWQTAVKNLVEQLYNEDEKLVDIKDKVNLSDWYDIQNAYCSNGIVYITLVIRSGNDFSTKESQLINDSRYYPYGAAYGFVNIQSTFTDINKILTVHISNLGEIHTWINGQLEYGEIVTFIYPLKS